MAEVTNPTVEDAPKPVDVVVNLDVSDGRKYEGLVVYVQQKERGAPKIWRGKFITVGVERVIPGTMLDDSGIAKNTKMTRHGHYANSIYITYDGCQYFRTRAFARVRTRCPKSLPYNLVRDLNESLDKCHPMTRDYDADAVITQDLYRILPAEERHCFKKSFMKTGEGHVIPTYNLPAPGIETSKEVIAATVPNGFHELKEPFTK